MAYQDSHILCKFTVAAALRQEPTLPWCWAAISRVARGTARSRLSREILLPELLEAALIPLTVMGEQSPDAPPASLGEPRGGRCHAKTALFPAKALVEHGAGCNPTEGHANQHGQHLLLQESREELKGLGASPPGRGDTWLQTR